MVKTLKCKCKKVMQEQKCSFLFHQFLFHFFSLTMTFLHLKCPNHFLFDLFLFYLFVIPLCSSHICYAMTFLYLKCPHHFLFHQFHSNHNFAIISVNSVSMLYVVTGEAVLQRHFQWNIHKYGSHQKLTLLWPT